MDIHVLVTVVLINWISFSGKANAFCAMSSEGLQADLTRAVVRSSDWLKQIYKDKSTKLRAYRAGSMFATLRIAGHYPSILLTEFKDAQNHTIEETLKNDLDKKGNLSNIPAPHLGLIIHGVIAICKDPKNFHGYNLIQPLLLGFNNFERIPSFNNYFGYSLAVIALCNANHQVPDPVIAKLVSRTNDPTVTYHSVDIDSLILTALSCVSTSNQTLKREVDKALSKLYKNLISKQNKTTGAFGNQYSTALAIEALQAARLYTHGYNCEKAMKHILSYQDELKDGSFGSILANIQVTPALLGESLTSLKKFPCPAEPTPTPTLISQIITVYVQVVFDVPNLKRNETVVSVTVLVGSTAKTILDEAAKENSCYKAKYKKNSFGHSITSICSVSSDWKKKQYWWILINGKSAQYGVDGLKPKNGDRLTFKYKKFSF